LQRSLPPLSLAFCAGAALRLAFGIPAPLVMVAVVFLAAGLRAARAGPRVSLALALGLAAGAGILRAAAWSRVPPNSVANLADRRWVRLHGVIIGEPVPAGSGLAFDLWADSAETRREPLTVSGKTRVFVPFPGAGGFRYGDRVAVEGRVSLPDDAANPGEIPPSQYLRREGVAAVLTARGVRREGGRGGSPLVALALAARDAMAAGINATLPPAEAGLLRGLLFSDTGALPDGARDDFARSGTVHILSTSGIHVALLAGLIAFFWRARQPEAQRRRALALLAGLLFFALMTGLRPAVLRAVLMTAVVLAAPLFDREPDAWSALALAALALVAASPANLLDPGFQLSFAAALALALWFDGRPRPAWRRVPGWVQAGMETSMVASLATAPLAIRYFGTASLAGPLTNLVMVPAVGPAMALGLIQGICWPWAAPAAQAAAFLNHGILAGMLWLAHWVGGMRWSAVETGPLPDAAIVLFYAAFGGALWTRLRTPTVSPRRWKPLLAPMAVAALPLMLAWRAWGPAPPLRVTFLDVGQGDSALIQTPGGRAILVDAGGRYEDGTAAPSDIGERVVVPALRRAGVRRLDVVVLTHPHEDHAGGLPAVFRALPVGLWLDSGQAHAAPGYTEALRLARAKGIPFHVTTAGERVEVEPGVALEVLAPTPPLFSGTRDDLNNNSIVFRLVYGRARFLFCGDAAWEAEERLLRSGADLRADVLKAGHHGSATSSGAPFLAAVAPRFAVISCGRHNRYGHPADATVARLQAAGAAVYRTDEDGGIVMTTRGDAIRVQTSRWTVP
jgi:competence protein ComEC